MKTAFAKPLVRSSGFTLVEILISITILGFAVMGTVALLTQALRTYYYDSGRLRVNRDIRTFTQDMDTDAAYANYFLIFPNFTSRSTGSPALDSYVADGQSGDFLVLLTTYTCLTNNTPNSGMVAGHNYVTKVVGYYRDATTTTTGPVRHVTAAVNYVDTTTLGNAPITTLLATAMPVANQSTNPVVVQIAEGLAVGTGSTSGLFYDFQDRSIMVRGQIIETNDGSITDVHRKAVNTYNFTVSPRG